MTTWKCAAIGVTDQELWMTGTVVPTGAPYAADQDSSQPRRAKRSSRSCDTISVPCLNGCVMAKTKNRARAYAFAFSPSLASPEAILALVPKSLALRDCESGQTVFPPGPEAVSLPLLSTFRVGPRPCLSRHCRGQVLVGFSDQRIVREALTNDPDGRLQESANRRALPMVVTERFRVQIAEQVERLDRDGCTFYVALKQ